MILGDCPHVVHQKSEAGRWVRNFVGDDLIEDIEAVGDEWAIAKGPKETIPSVHRHAGK